MWAEVGVTANIVSSALATYDAQHNGQFQACIALTARLPKFPTCSSSTNPRLVPCIQGNDDWLDGKLLELRTYYYDDPQQPPLASMQ